MENLKVFQDRNIVGICEYMSNYCTANIISSNSLSHNSVMPLYNFFPVFLVYIFGSPNTRGWIQTETQPIQDQAIKSLLSVNSPFIQALKKLSVYPKYSYALVTDSLPVDIQKVLSTGATHLLPRVYASCSNVNTTSVSNLIDLRSAATKQSTLLPNGSGGERVIRLNMIQLYIFYFLSVPTWEPLRPPPVPSTAYGSTTNGIRGFNTSASYNTSYMPFSSNNSANNLSPNPQHQIIGNLRSVALSVYCAVLEEYFDHFIPQNSNNMFPDRVGTFFLDACVELWIRTRWVASGQKLSDIYMQCITAFVKYITCQDLRKAMSKNNIVIAEAYRTVKYELYMLISRLALNWSKDNDYLSVVDLWAIWAAPWKFGQQPSSSDNMIYAPTAQGWGHVIMDNIPFYVLLVDILLQRTGTFMYKDSEVQQQQSQSQPFQQLQQPQQPQPQLQPQLQQQPQPQPQQQPQLQPQPQPQQQYRTPIAIPSTSSSFMYGTAGSDLSNIRGNLRILYRIINVLKAEGLVEFLGHIEQGLKHIKSDVYTSKQSDSCKYLSNSCYGTERMDVPIIDKLNSVHDILVQVNGGVWITKGLYLNDGDLRSSELIKTVNSIRSAIAHRKDLKSEKAKAQITQLEEAYERMCQIFKINESDILNSSSNNQREANQSQPLEQQYKPEIAGSNTNGFLTEEERQSVLKGKTFCTPDNIQPLGDRSKAIVRTYEFSWMVYWISTIDQKLNYFYNRLLPEENRPGFFPDELTLRPLASRRKFYISVVIATVASYFFLIKAIEFFMSHLLIISTLVILFFCSIFRKELVAFYSRF
ncbi:hypothetical protein BD560DRAFT_190865 [Blakeslea trispora]|nr:hypothetical protein BD560DRAFT_190865 [Blakeslea trispora]